MSSEDEKSAVRGADFYTRYGDSAEAPAHAYQGLQMHGMPGLHAKMTEYVAQNLRPGSSILDLGCGSGALCQRFADAGYSASGCDGLSESFGLHGRIPFWTADLNSNFSESISDRFDAISATEVIEHMENPRHFLRQCRKLLKDGGKIFLSTPNIDSSMAKAYYVRAGNFWMFSDDYYSSVGHITPVSKWLLLKSLEEAGFRVSKVDSFAGWGSFLTWWKARAMAWLFRMTSASVADEGQILIVVAEAV